MKCLASSQGPKVRVNAVLPGLLLTDWVRLALFKKLYLLTIMKGLNYSPERIEQLKATAKLKQEVGLPWRQLTSR